MHYSGAVERNSLHSVHIHFHIMSKIDRKTDIEQQLAHLRWRLAQNERSIRNSLESTKNLRENDTMLQISVDNVSTKKLWISSFVEKEISTPLILNESEYNKLRKGGEA